MKKAGIENIIFKKLLDEASVEELRLLETWKNDSMENNLLYDSYALLWDKSADYEPIDFEPNVDAALSKHLSVLMHSETIQEEATVIQMDSTTSSVETIYSTTKIFTLKRLSSLAAIFILAIASVFIMKSFNTTTISSADSQMFASLEDGSSIWLDKNSSISFTKGFGTDHRNIKLEGKAFFEVKRNENLSFNISASELNVSVLGTSFTVDTYNNVREVAVKTGRVEVADANGSTVINANQKVALVDDKLIKSIVDNDSAKWRNPLLSFDNSPLDQVISDINLFHNNRITFETKLSSESCPFTSTGLSNESLENIVEILRISYDLEVQNLENNNIKLTISDCK